MKVFLDKRESEILFRQPPETAHDGGFQKLLVSLQNKTDSSTGELDLTSQDLERIARYAFDYGNGGWESRLTGIFSRHLGSRLGRKP
jgi:hypothetical protein